MSLGTKSYSDAMHEYTDYLVKLHRLIREGQGDTDEADELRDLMDGPWYKMTSVELSLVRGLSEDLYSLYRTNDSTAAIDRDTEFERMKSYTTNKDWISVLDYARKIQPKLSQSEISYLRGTCWSEFGFPAVAAEFFRVMIRNPSVTVLEKSAYYNSLIESKNYSEAFSFSSIFDDNTHPLLWMQYGSAFSNKIFEENVLDPTEMQQATGIILHAIRLASEEPSAIASEIGITVQKWISLIVELELNLAMLYYLLNDLSSARSHIASILRDEPNQPEALLIKSQVFSDQTQSESRVVGQYLARTLSPITFHCVNSIGFLSTVN